MCNIYRYRVFDPGTCTWFTLDGWSLEQQEAHVFVASGKDNAVKWVGEWAVTVHPRPKLLVVIQDDAESAKSSFRMALECLDASHLPNFRPALSQVTGLPHLSRCASRKASRRCNCGKDERDLEINDFLSEAAADLVVSDPALLADALRNTAELEENPDCPNCDAPLTRDEVGCLECKGCGLGFGHDV